MRNPSDMTLDEIVAELWAIADRRERAKRERHAYRRNCTCDDCSCVTDELTDMEAEAASYRHRGTL